MSIRARRTSIGKQYSHFVLCVVCCVLCVVCCVLCVVCCVLCVVCWALGVVCVMSIYSYVDTCAAYLDQQIV